MKQKLKTPLGGVSPSLLYFVTSNTRLFDIRVDRSECRSGFYMSLFHWFAVCFFMLHCGREIWLCTSDNGAFALLYLAIVFMLAGTAHADEQQWVSIQWEWWEVGRLMGRGVDTVMNIWGALHGEERRAGWGTPENQQKEIAVTLKSGLVLANTQYVQEHILPCMIDED